MADVFISYARKDIRLASLVARVLQNEGFSTFYDVSADGIRPGEEWIPRLEQELINAKCCIVLWSAASVRSPMVRSEARRALERRILLPVQLEPCSLPLGFDEIHAIDLSGWQGHPDDHRWRFLVDGGVSPKTGRITCRLSKRRVQATAPLSVEAPGPHVNTSPVLRYSQARSSHVDAARRAPSGVHAKPEWMSSRGQTLFISLLWTFGTYFTVMLADDHMDLGQLQNGILEYLGSIPLLALPILVVIVVLLHVMAGFALFSWSHLLRLLLKPAKWSPQIACLK